MYEITHWLAKRYRGGSRALESWRILRGVALWSGQFVKAWSKTLSSGEFELAAVVRAASEGLGLQSILSDFDLCGHEAISPMQVLQLGWSIDSD